jgi:alpha-mannosidase
MPHFMPFAFDSVVPAAYALNAPLRAASLETSPGEVATLPSLVACEDRNLVIEAVKKAEDSDDLVVRLYECHNTRGRAELSTFGRPSSAWLCDLEENPIAELDVTEGLVAFEYKPFEILTIRLTRS